MEALTRDEQAALDDLVWEMTAPHTQAEIAARLGISQPRVAALEKRALRKLRKLMTADAAPSTEPAVLHQCLSDDHRSPLIPSLGMRAKRLWE